VTYHLVPPSKLTTGVAVTILYRQTNTMLSLPKVAVVLIVLTPASGFTAGNNYSNGRTSTALNIFRKAFANDDSLGKAENPGLKKVIMQHLLVRIK
jgi:hypothetical protein